MRKGIIALCVIAFCSFSFVACEKEGPAEKAGKKLDQAFDAAKDKVKEVAE
jgi:hypothetical protein